MPKRKPLESPDDVSPASFEVSLTELQTIVSDLEDGALGLETSLARFERGVRLLRQCYSILDAAEAKVELLTQFQGENPPITAPFENTATFEWERKNSGRSGLVVEENETGAPSGQQEDSSKSSLF